MKTCERRFADQGFFFLIRIIHLTNGFPIPSCSSSNYISSTIVVLIKLFKVSALFQVVFPQSASFPTSHLSNFSSHFSTFCLPIFVARFSRLPFFPEQSPLGNSAAAALECRCKDGSKKGGQEDIADWRGGSSPLHTHTGPRYTGKDQETPGEEKHPTFDK